MTNRISQQRCFNHQQREAAARCLACGRFFCRECITEHEDRLLCSKCLRETAGSMTTKLAFLFGPAKIFQFFCGMVILWYVFFHLGDLLLELPSSFHEGTLWMSQWWTE